VLSIRSGGRRLEEPVYPPEDFQTLGRLQEMAGEGTGVDIAAGENACTAFEFAKLFEAGAVRFAQPSVIKCGGVAETYRIAQLARGYGSASHHASPRPVSHPIKRSVIKESL
jgi:L-alanine-DL-glutamate epimerase-like enolase superfamily enzyme